MVAPLASVIRDAVFAAVGRECQTAPLAAGVAAVGAAGEDDHGAVRLRIGDVDLLIHGAGSGLAPRAVVLIRVFCQNTRNRPLCSCLSRYLKLRV